MSLFGVAGSTPSDSGFELKSVRFDGDDAYLERTFLTEGNRKTYTLSVWVKRGDIASQSGSSDPQAIFSSDDTTGASDTRSNYLSFYGTGTYLDKLRSGSDAGAVNCATASVFRDPSAWYHIVWVMDTTQITAADRLKIYVNGANQSFSHTSYPSQNMELGINRAQKHRIGMNGYNTSNEMQGYMAEFYFIDGLALTPAYFGETDALTNEWTPLNPTDIKSTVAFGGNGFYLPFNNDKLAASFIDESLTEKALSPDPGPPVGNWSVNSAGVAGAGGGQSYMYTQFPFVPSENLSVDVLVVAGGGGGGGDDDGWGSGGGGAGGVSEITGKSVTADTEYVVKVGRGGIGGNETYGPAPYRERNSSCGASSSFDTIISNGGGYAGPTEGYDGGSGGGGSRSIGPSGDSNQGNTGGATGYGNDAGFAGPSGGGGAGGGGAGAAGSTNNTDVGGAGGNGRSNSIQTGSAQTYAGGGGGGTGSPSSPGGTGGSGGGGNGAAGGPGNHPGSDATGWGSGGGGSGGATNAGAFGGYGSPGIVVVRYQSATAKATGGKITTYGTGGSQYYVHTFDHLQHFTTPSGDAKNTRISSHSSAVGGNAHVIGPKLTGTSSVIAAGLTSDYITVPSSAQFGWADDVDFTVEAWANIYQIGAHSEIIGCGSPSSNWRLAIGSAGKPQWNHSGSSPELEPDIYAGEDEWFHLAVSRSGNTSRMFLNGVLVESATDNYAYPTGILHIACYSNGSYGLGGYLADLRISNNARYTANFTPHTEPLTSDANTMFLLQSDTTMGSTTFTDSSSNTHTCTANGDVMHVAPKIGKGMAVFDGVASYLEQANSGDWNMAAGDFTIEYWVSYDTLSAGGYTSGRGTGYGGSSDNRWGIRHETTGNVTFMLSDGNSSSSTNKYDFATSGLSLDDKAWHHCAFVREGLTARIYTDGVQRNSQALAAGFTLQYATSVNQIGRYPNYSYTGPFKGYIDEMRFSRTCRYPSGTTFTPSTTAFQDDQDTVLLLHSDGGGGIDPATNLPTLLGEGRYFWDASNNAIYRDSAGLPTYKSLIGFDGTTDYISIKDSDDWNFTASEATIECWVKFTTMPESVQLIGQNDGNTSDWFLYVYANGTVAVGIKNVNEVASSSKIINTGVWYHIAAVREGSGSSVVTRIYVNGTSVANNTGQYFDSSGERLYIGGRSQESGSNRYLNGWLDGIRLSNIKRYSSTFTPPTEPYTTDVNTLLLIQSNDFSEGGLGADHSGNYNYFTPNNLTADDLMIDSPKNTVGGNFCTWNPLWGRTSKMPVLSEGNLVGKSSDAAQTPISATFAGIESGKWYWEIEIKAKGASDCKIGLINSSGQMTDVSQSNHYYRLYLAATGNKFSDTNASTVAYGNTYAAGDIVGIALDMDNGALYFAKNGTWQTSGDPTSGATKTGAAYTDVLSAVPAGGKGGGYGWAPYVDASDTTVKYAANFGADSSFAGEKTAQGNQDGNDKGDFYYTPPTGYLALCSDNLPTPSIELPGDHFNTVLYTGDGSSIAVTGVGFQPDFTWIKNAEALQDHTLVDSVRGATKYLVSNDTDIEVTNSAVVASLDSDGFTVGTVNSSNTKQYVGWNWKTTGGAAVAKTYAVTVAASKLVIGGFSQATVNMREGSTYTFDTSNASLSGHTFKFATAADAAGSTQYTTGVTETGTPGNAGAKTVIVVAGAAPQLFYYCSVHTGMGGSANTNTTAGSSNYDGSIASTVSANTTAGFSIVKYTSPGTNNDETIGHGLSQRPDMVIVKNLDTTFNWDVWSPFLSSGHDLRLNTNDAQTSGRWSTTIPTASLVTLKDNFEVDGTDEYIAYCFHSVEGYSKVGTFEGVSSTDGPWVYLGFKPAYILLKNWGANGHWNISDSVQDPDNPVMEYIYANSTDHNTPNANWDFLSNGFKMRINDSYWNTGSNNYLYYAVAENPFKYSIAR